MPAVLNSKCVMRLKVRGRITWMRKIVLSAAPLCNVAKNLRLFKRCPLLSNDYMIFSTTGRFFFFFNEQSYSYTSEVEYH